MNVFSDLECKLKDLKEQKEIQAALFHPEYINIDTLTEASRLVAEVKHKKVKYKNIEAKELMRDYKIAV